LELDQALIRLGYLSEDGIAFCDERYGVDTARYVGKERVTEVCNMHACVETEASLRKENVEELGELLTRFRELEQQMELFCAELATAGVSDVWVSEMFKADVEVIPALIEEMRGIVTLFRKTGKREQKSL
jgi:GH24 family phage-related lysozyme (muramidase)